MFSPCIVTEPHNLKILPFLLHTYHTPQLKNITIPATVFLPYDFKFCQSANWVSNPTQFLFETGIYYVSIIITITSNFTVLVSRNVICFGYSMPMSHGVNKAALFCVNFAVLYICVSQSTFSQFCHHQTTIRFPFAYMPNFLFGLSSNGLKITSRCCFFQFPRKLSSRLILPP